MEKIPPQEVQSVLSIVLAFDETSEIKKLSEDLGVSLSHLGRALLRLGLKSLHNGKEVKEKALLELVKLGR